jgi:hypothetical protein
MSNESIRNKASELFKMASEEQVALLEIHNDIAHAIMVGKREMKPSSMVHLREIAEKVDNSMKHCKRMMNTARRLYRTAEMDDEYESSIHRDDSFRTYSDTYDVIHAITENHPILSPLIDDTSETYKADDTLEVERSSEKFKESYNKILKEAVDDYLDD